MRLLCPSIRPATAALALAAALAAAPGTIAQNLHALHVPDTPLTLKSRGSFYVGGESVRQSRDELGNEVLQRGLPTEHITVNQMYVEYMVPTGTLKAPVVMVHGAGLSGKSYDTTPDGRMGWFEYFVRRQHPAYVVDQVGRARSGFNQASYNRVASGEQPADSLPRPWRFGDEAGVWTNFRFGPRPGEAFADTQFPVAAIGELAKQAIPDMTATVSQPNPTLRALAMLAADLKGAVLLGHSQSGHFPMEAALIDPTSVRAIVSVEPGTCNGSRYSDEQIARLSRIPTLILFGDHLPAPTGFTQITWQDRFDDCQTYVRRVKAAGGQVQMLHTPDAGVRGNSHMLMHDRNHLHIADAILRWIADPTRPARLNAIK
ncbi:MAG: hypothetical protein Q4G71_05230 [Pseudomonadota bacterium]|nr:hypothetical protein [Pseudomonadota bacterium]